ncbi:hypothetical protein CXB77_00135 [Chromatium okenii]|uniref:Uncharacterized protein n=1 Tax=Chromatium okenii TaxID=61644 RepID=A0A2S7XVJ2_9GAMM|nr:hypothetical protein CXB77_00135 [Chromatium okenii]
MWLLRIAIMQHFNYKRMIFWHCATGNWRPRDTDHVDEMLIQHILTDQIFRAIFSDVNFIRKII